jgi:CheY-like chemotaxis protein
VRVRRVDAEGHLVSVILVIQPDADQARVLHDMARRIGADLVVVDSTKKAVDAIGRQVPDLILLSAFLSPRDEDTLMGRLRSLESTSHLQMMTIPQFQAGDEPKAKKSGFGFRKKQKAPVAVGADPAAFAEEVTALLSRAREIRNRPAPVAPVNTVIAREPEPPPAPLALIDDADASSTELQQNFASSELQHDFGGPGLPPSLSGGSEEQDPPYISAEQDAPYISPEATADHRSLGVGGQPWQEETASLPDDEPVFVNAIVGGTYDAEPAVSSDDSVFYDEPLAVEAPVAAATPTSSRATSIADEIDQLVRQLGLDVKMAGVESTPPGRTDEAPSTSDDAGFDFGASLDRARNRALTRSEENTSTLPDAEAIRESALAEARAVAKREAREASAAEIARVQAEAEAMRQAAEARAAAERQAREALAADLARAQKEAEEKRQAAIAEAEERAAAEREAREALAADLARAKAEAEHKRQAAIAEAEARAAAEREAREALAADLARAQAQAEQQRLTAIAEARAAAEKAAREALAAEVARAQMEAEQQREAAIAEARAAAEREAREALAADLARLQVEAEEMRQKAITDAKASAEREARQTLEAEVARVRSEAQSTFSDALNKVKVEAEEAERRRVEAERVNAEAQHAFARELLRVRSEVEQSLTSQLDAARAEAERIRAAEAEAVRERAAVETQLKAELDRLKFIAAQARKADESETKKASQQIRQLEAELASVRAKAEEHKGHELEELRAQMVEMREAAAQHARAAAAEAVAAAVAAAAPKPSAVIAQFPVREAARVEPLRFEPEPQQRDSRDYLSLWQPKSPPPVEVEEADDLDEPEESFVSAVNMRRHAKWALPVAACLILVTNTGTAISTVSELVKAEAKPALVVEPVKEDMPFVEMVEKRVGKLQLDSTPSGAEAILDGKNFGRTPLTIPDLDVGLHTLQLKSSSGTITRKVTIKANQTTLLSEAIYSGWLAIFSPIPVKVVVDGRPVSLTEDGRAMVTPGGHVVEFVNEQFNYRSTEKLDVRPGETTAHTLTMPTGTVRVTAPDGSAILVDGQPAVGSPAEGLSVSIGSHEISAKHPDLGERRMPVDVKHGGLTEVTLRFE